MPFFSIVIPTYNRASFIQQAISAIRSQKFEDFEILIIDDGSIDNTEEVVKNVKDPRVLYFRKENGERGAARNFGTKLSKGKYINFFDSDDIFMENRLSIFYKYIIENKFPDFIHSRFKIKDASGNERKQVLGSYKNFNRDLISNNFLACGSVFLRRELALAEPFVEDLDLTTAEDWELWLRISPKVIRLDIPLPTYWQMEHIGRSLNTINWNKIKLREEKLLHYFTKESNEFYGSLKGLFIADRYTYLALCIFELSMPKKVLINHLLNSISQSFLVFTRKRFWAALSKLFKSRKYVSQ